MHRSGRLLAAAAVAVLALGALVWAVGVEAVHDVLAGVGPGAAATLAVVGLLPLVLWGVSLRLVLGSIGRTSAASGRSSSSSHQGS